MKYDPQTEVYIFQIVREEGESDRKRIIDELKNRFSIELNETDLLRYLHRWKARKVITIRTRRGVEVWAITEIPPWYSSGMMDVIKKTTKEAMKVELKSLNDRLKEGITYIDKTPLWHDYTSYELIFENIDPILGGRPTEEERKTAFPRREDKLILPASWFNGWFRDNQAMLNQVGLQYHVGWGTGEFIEPPILKDITLKVKVGLNTYEAVMPGGKFKQIMSFPFKGSKIQNEEQLRRFFTIMGVTPIRGFGANAKALGGRIKLLEMNKIEI